MISHSFNWLSSLGTDTSEGPGPDPIFYLLVGIFSKKIINNNNLPPLPSLRIPPPPKFSALPAGQPNVNQPKREKKKEGKYRNSVQTRNAIDPPLFNPITSWPAQCKSTKKKKVNTKIPSKLQTENAIEKEKEKEKLRRKSKTARQREKFFFFSAHLRPP